MNKILLLFFFFFCIAALTEKKIRMFPEIERKCLKFDSNPTLEVYFKSEGSGFTEEVQFDLKFVDVEYIPTKCVILKDGAEALNSKIKCTLDISTFGVDFLFAIPKQPPTIENVTIENWNYEGKKTGMCSRDVNYLFSHFDNYKMSCGEKEKILEIQGKMENKTNIKETAKTVLNVEPYILVNNKAEKVNCNITFDGAKTVDNEAKMSCLITTRENKGKFLMTNPYENNKKYYVGIDSSKDLDFTKCEPSPSPSSSWFIKGLGILLINILIL